jgi:galactan endo-1,6-beta-galactosidase
MIHFASLLIAAQSSTLVIDPAATQGKWEGWGTSLCWMGKMFGDRDDVADVLFTTKTVTLGNEAVPGLGMTIVRYNAGACSWNEIEGGRKMVVGKTIQPFRQMEGFWTDPKQTDADKWNWNLDANQRAMMAKAKKRGANRFELFSNAPMWWMCANDNPSGGADPMKDNLRPDHHDEFAKYMAEIAKRSKEKWGIAFTTINPFNEPLSKWWDENCKQEGCHFSIPAQRSILYRLRGELDQRGLKSLPIAASDETYISHSIDAWKGYNGATRALVSQINVHGYQGEKSPREELRTLIGERKLWVSEHGEGDASGFETARAIGLDFQKLRPTAWCYWQPLDGGGWGSLESDVPNAKIRKANPKHFVLAQYMRHIRPGMTILATGDANSVAALDTKRNRLVVVLANTGEAARSTTLDLSGFRPGGTATTWLTEPKGSARYRKEGETSYEGYQFTVELPPHTIKTLEIDVTPREKG